MFYQQQNSVGQNFFECRRYKDFAFAAHMHRHPEVLLVRVGETNVFMDGYSETVHAGECALIPSNHVHAFHTDVHSLVDVCIFSEDLAPMFARDMRGKYPGGVRFAPRREVLNFAGEMLFQPGAAQDVYQLKAALYAVLGEYRQRVAWTASPSRSDALIARIIGYVAQNFSENITLKSMAAALGYEPHYLSRCFHSVIPMHFSRYVNWYRVDAATELLQSTDLSVTEVALRSGFQSIRSFNRVYLDMTGRLPTQTKRKE